MRKKRFYIFFPAFLVLFALPFHYGQKSDSIIKVIGSYTKEDTIKVQYFYKAGFYLQQEGNYSKALEYLNESKKLAEKLNFKSGEGLACNRIGLVYQDIDEFDKARQSFIKGLDIFKSTGSLYKIAISYNSLGNLEETAGNYNAALKNYFSYLDFAEKLKSQVDIAIAYNNIAIVYSDIGDYKKELTYNFKALKIRETLNDPGQLAASYNNIGICYQYVDNYAAAISYFTKALEIRVKLNDPEEVAAIYHNMAICYKYLGNFKLSEEYYVKALNIQQQLNLNPDIALTSINIGRLYLDNKNYKKAFLYLNKALEIATDKKLIGYQTDAHQALFDAYESANQAGPALYHFKKYVELKDSLNNVEKSKEFTRIEMQNKFDHEQAINKSNQDKKDAVARQQQKQQRIILFSVSILLLIISGFLFFVYRSFHQKKEANIIITLQKQEVEEQKHLVEEKQKEIIDSITYAQRIQSAILAREDDIKEYFPESFLLYSPKDIVAGDFYFFETNNRHVFYAAADCTGHGVPGALVSVVCSNALSRCVKEFGLTDPGEILNKTRELVLETFKKSGQDVKDGMDISLLVKNINENSFSWSGANNPLWFIHNSSIPLSVNEITANKQPIGLSDSPAPFLTHHLNLEKGDQVFLFTDGYADQFGGPRGKKFKYRQLEELLVSTVGLAPQLQKQKLKDAFENWKGQHEQVDDVLVIGIRVT